MAEVKELIGKILKVIVVDQSKENIIFICYDKPSELGYCAKNGDIYRMFHMQECCEDVRIEEIDGDINWLINAPIVEAAEETNTDNPKAIDPDNPENKYHTWTFYKFSTRKGSVTIRWYGTSSGAYSERVNFEKLDGEKLGSVAEMDNGT